MKDKIVKFFTKIKNHAVKLLTMIKGHFIKHKQRYMRVLLVILCVYLVLLALCSIGRCARKNVITADALGESTNTYFEVPVAMLYNSSTWYGSSGSSRITDTFVISNPIYLRLSRNLDFLGVSSITSDGSSEFIPVQTPFHYSYDAVGCTLVESTSTLSGLVSETSSVDCTVDVRFIRRVYGSYPAITRIHLIPVENSAGVSDKLRVELFSWSEGSEDPDTVICSFEITAMSFNDTPFTFLGYDVSYSFSTSDTYSNGYTAGREAGYNEGYSRGYANGSQTVSGENQFTSLMNAIVFVPINALWNVLNFEVLGINVFTFVTAVITILVIAWLWGKIK